MADIKSATDYYPFGAPMADRSWNASSTLNGFNGKRKDSDVYGEGNAYDFQERIYDSRLAKFFSVDPVFKNAAAYSPFQFAKNSPVYNIDSKGNEAIGYIGEDGKLYIQTTYVYISEGAGSFKDAEINTFKQATETIYSGAAGQKVVYNGKEYEVGGITVNFVAGGKYSEAAAKADATFGDNLLVKQSTKNVELVSEQLTGNPVSPQTAAITLEVVPPGGEKTGVNNTTVIKESALNGTLIDEVRKATNNPKAQFQSNDMGQNAINDEAGHQMGTRHPNPNNPDDLNKQFGSMERGLLDASGNLILNKQDIQNMVNSCEFNLNADYSKQGQTQATNDQQNH